MLKVSLWVFLCLFVVVASITVIGASFAGLVEVTHVAKQAFEANKPLHSLQAIGVMVLSVVWAVILMLLFALNVSCWLKTGSACWKAKVAVAESQYKKMLQMGLKFPPAWIEPLVGLRDKVGTVTTDGSVFKDLEKSRLIVSYGTSTSITPRGEALANVFRPIPGNCLLFEEEPCLK